MLNHPRTFDLSDRADHPFESGDARAPGEERFPRWGLCVVALALAAWAPVVALGWLIWF